MFDIYDDNDALPPLAVFNETDLLDSYLMLTKVVREASATIDNLFSFGEMPASPAIPAFIESNRFDDMTTLVDMDDHHAYLDRFMNRFNNILACSRREYAWLCEWAYDVHSIVTDFEWLAEFVDNDDNWNSEGECLAMLE